MLFMVCVDVCSHVLMCNTGLLCFVFQFLVVLNVSVVYGFSFLSGDFSTTFVTLSFYFLRYMYYLYDKINMHTNIVP